METLIKKLIDLEQRFGGKQTNIPRRKVSPHDPRDEKRIAKGGMLGGNRMSPDEHNYSPHYAKYLKKKIDANKPVVLVEFGILKGTGLAIWSEFLPKGSRVIGFDIDLSHFIENCKNLNSLGAGKHSRIEAHHLDQFVDNTRKIKEVLKGDMVDVVVDDGVHFPAAIIQSMLSIWPFLADDFVYFVEDNKSVHNNIKINFPKAVVDSQEWMTIITGQSFRQWISKATGYEMNYLNPVTYNEKVNFKKLFDRNPLLPMTADKYRAREYVINTLGADDILKPLILATDDPGSIPWDNLPDNYVVKPNHMSGAYRIVRDGKADLNDLRQACKNWISRKYAPFSMEWAYLPIKPMIMIEALLDNRPESFKFHTFHGKVQFVKVISGGIEAKKNRCFTFYTPDTWDYIPVTWDKYGHEDIPRPDRLEEMVALAEQLAKPFDYVRVDFALSGDQIYFEELTHYPTGGHSTLVPIDYEMEWGNLWQISLDYWQ